MGSPTGLPLVPQMNALWKAAAALLVIAGVLAVTYSLGKNEGMLEEGGKWKDEKIALDAKVLELTGQVKTLEQTNQLETTRVADELAANEQRHAKALADLAADYTQRLLGSESRANVYKRQSQGSTAERDYLASHAAELDRSLEEGRSLVRELGETLRQRDSTIRSLSEQILADRRLLMSTP